MTLRDLKEDRLLYIADILRELHKMAKRDDFGLVPYIILMAVIEAEHTYCDDLVRGNRNLRMERNAN
ncbi:hypothetical protein DUT91_17660 [Phyllobacterium salinisoli]|uniref:Uncharacterized protein n=1 Tax=Phyllobacterium salinisoli TaxID=1899321 RepID=A0A368K0K4_9HYPH|nr:hypothetical protein DUT91_17660 [Phyllobacterium salinisoli]